MSFACLPTRNQKNGVDENRELAPALKATLTEVLKKAGQDGLRVELRQRLPIADFTRPKSEIDLVVFGTADNVELVAELRCWDVGHQLFDLAKVCCVLATGIPAGFLVCAAQRSADFDRAPGGELYPAEVGETRHHRFSRPDLQPWNGVAKARWEQVARADTGSHERHDDSDRCWRVPRCLPWARDPCGLNGAIGCRHRCQSLSLAVPTGVAEGVNK